MKASAIFVFALFAAVAFAGNLTISVPVDSVTLYSNGYSFVTREGNISLPGDSTLHIINFTALASQYSITPKMSGVRLIDYYPYTMQWNETTNQTRYFSLDSLLNQSIGKSISFKSSNTSITGTLAWYSNEMVGISQSNGVSIYKISEISDLSLPATRFSEQINETKTEHGLALTVSGTGQKNLTVSYLTSGATWSAAYKYYISSEANSGTGNLQGYATISNNADEDWENASLRLVVGYPRIAQASIYDYHYYSVGKIAGTDAYAPSAETSFNSFSSSQISAYHVYSLEGRATVRNGEARTMPLLEEPLSYKREYFWDTSSTYPEKIFILNNTAEPLASGTASVFLGNEFLGEASINYTATGSEARVSVSDMPQIATKKETLNSTTTTAAANGSTARTTTYVMKLTLKNALDESATLRINDQMYYGDVVSLVSSSTPATQKPGNVLEWNPTIPAGGSLEITYVYRTTTYDPAVRYY